MFLNFNIKKYRKVNIHKYLIISQILKLKKRFKRNYQTTIFEKICQNDIF